MDTDVQRAMGRLRKRHAVRAQRLAGRGVCQRDCQDALQPVGQHHPTVRAAGRPQGQQRKAAAVPLPGRTR